MDHDTDVLRPHPAGQVYVKHHSFTGFWSRIASDEEHARRRAREKLAQNLREETLPAKQRAVAEAALRALASSDTTVQDFKITPFIADELARVSDEAVSTYVIHRYRYDVYPDKRILDDYPPYLQIEPTSICNYRCVFCYQVDASFSRTSSGYMGSMGFDLFKEIVDQISGEIHFLSLASRGEPLIAREIDRMLEYCSGKFLGLKLNTNASLLDEKHCHAILAGGVNTVVFSIDAAEEPLYSELRVNGRLEHVLRNLELFHAIREKSYPRSKIITRISGVKVSAEQNMTAMVARWGDLVDQISFVAYNPWENVYETAPNGIGTPCSDLWRRMFVWYDGGVNPCDTDYKSTLSVGRIQGRDVSEIWRSEAYERLRERHAAGERAKLDPCRRCVVI